MAPWLPAAPGRMGQVDSPWALELAIDDGGVGLCFKHFMPKCDGDPAAKAQGWEIWSCGDLTYQEDGESPLPVKVCWSSSNPCKVQAGEWSPATSIADAGGQTAIRRCYRATPLTEGGHLHLEYPILAGLHPSILRDHDTFQVTTVNAPSCHLEPHPIFGPHRNIANIISR